MLYPIAETFHSIKGEGYWTGVPMKFIRFAGCNVGKVVTRAGDKVDTSGHEAIHPLVGIGLEEKRPAWQCHTYDNRPFWCDTDFHKYEELDEEQLLHDVWEGRIVLTGGEPLIHLEKLGPLLELARKRDLKVHIETSGTIDWRGHFNPGSWFAVAPKANYIPELFYAANEIKLLVDKNFDLDTVPEEIFNHKRVYLMPINGVKEHNKRNVELCMEIQKEHPKWTLCAQLHKFLGVL